MKKICPVCNKKYKSVITDNDGRVIGYVHKSDKVNILGLLYLKEICKVEQ